MSFTKCCNHRFIGDNHSPIRPDGYCLHCGFHPEIESLKAEIGIYKANEKLMQMRLEDIKEANKVLREAVIYELSDIDDSIVFDANTEKVVLDALEKADEIMGEKK